MVAMLLFVLELGDRLVLVRLLRALARFPEVRFADVLRADRDVRQQLLELGAATCSAGGRITGSHQSFELVLTLQAFVFVERHVCSLRLTSVSESRVAGPLCAAPLGTIW